MRTKILLTALILFSLKAVYSQAELPVIYREYININQNTNKIKETKIHVRTEILITDEKQDTLKIQYFDTEGKLIQEYRIADDKFNVNKKIRYNYSYVYGKNGMLIQRIDSTFNEAVKINLYYDDIGSISNEKEYNSRGIMLREVEYDYDELSRLIEANEVNYINNCNKNTLYEYDSYNNLAKLTSKRLCPVTEAVNEVYKYSYKYDNKYNIIEKQTVFPNKTFKMETYEYDAKGNIVKSYESVNKNEYNEYIHHYDNAGNRIKSEKREVNGESDRSYTEVLSYNDKGNVAEIFILKPDDQAVTTRKYIYEYY